MSDTLSGNISELTSLQGVISPTPVIQSVLFSGVQIPANDWDKISGKPTTFPPSAHSSSHRTYGSDSLSPADIGAAAASHTHQIPEVLGLTTSLSVLSAGLDSLSGRVNTISSASSTLLSAPSDNLYARKGDQWIQLPTGTASTASWDAVTGKPSSFNPSAHKSRHAINGSDPLTPVDIGAASLGHTHSISEVVGLTDALNGRQRSGSYATLDGTGKVPKSQISLSATDVGAIVDAPDTSTQYARVLGAWQAITVSGGGGGGGSSVSLAPSTLLPAALGTASAGTSTLAARADHVHNLPTASQITGLGTAATKDAPASGNASLIQVVLGSDSRLSPLVFTGTGTSKSLSSYNDSGTIKTVRSTTITGGQLSLTLASFTPTLSSASFSSLKWDDVFPSFTASVQNPSDFTSQWISSVSSISGASGALTGFTIGTQTATPSGGGTWSQTFTGNTSRVYSNGTGSSGGSASYTLYFTDNSGTTDAVNWKATGTGTWADAVNTLTVGGLSGNTFLQTYTSTTYGVTVSGLSNTANAVHSVTASGGSLSNGSGGGTFTFTTPIHKNTSGIPSVSLSTVFTRPANVTGSTSYTATVTKGPTSPTVSFTYPSFWLFLANGTTPSSSAIVSGTAYATGVSLLSDQTKSFATTVNNPSTSPQTFWFGIRSSASQPTSFQIGSSASLLVNASLVSGSPVTVSLQPTSSPTGYVAESFSLYGIVLQPGNTYVSIS